MEEVHAKKLILIAITALIAAEVFFFTAYFLRQAGWPASLFPPTSVEQLPIKQPQNFEECKKFGYSVTASYPAKCRVDGLIFTEDIGNELTKRDLIRLVEPRPNQVVASPLIISGFARGYWFFEGSFPIKLIDERGNEIARGSAATNAEWMTENFIPFSAELKFDAAKIANSARGTIILKKDNPSELPEHDDALIVPIRFK